MSSPLFGTYNDNPSVLENDSTGLNLCFTRIDNTSGTLSWSIPESQTNCKTTGSSYNGILIIGSEQQIPSNVLPKATTLYQEDPTMDRNLHCGDSIGPTLVVANTYDDPSTNSVTITGLKPDVGYFFAGFAVDQQLSYSTGSYNYPLTLSLQPKPSQDPYCDILYNKQLQDTIVLDNQLTYKFNVTLGEGKTTKSYDIVIDPSTENITTFEQLIVCINDKFKRVQANYTDNQPPNINTLYIDNNQINLWDGFKGITQNTIVSSTDPTSSTVYFDKTNFFTLNQNQFESTRTVFCSTDPTKLPCNIVWINNDKAYINVNGAWVQCDLYQQQTNPLQPKPFKCSSIWYDTISFKQYISTTNQPIITKCDSSGYWIDVNVTNSPTDPSKLQPGSYWYNSSTASLYILNDDSLWDHMIVSISDTKPLTNAVNWFQPQTKQLKIWNYNILDYSVVDVVVSNSNPLIPPPSNLWFDQSNLYRWDSYLKQYKQIELVVNKQDPLLPPILKKTYVWFDSTNCYLYDGSDFIKVEYIFSNKDPSYFNNGEYWFDTKTNTLNQYNNKNWILVDYITSINPLNLLTAGTFWVNPSNNIGKVWNGFAWTNIITGNPIPQKDFKWYNGTNLYQWNGTQFISIKGDLTAEYNSGNIRITGISIHCAPVISIKDGSQPTPDSLVRGLFHSTKGNVNRPTSGFDAIDGVPSYSKLGVGTDGNQAHRRELIDNILHALGSPAIEVELSKPQLQYCVDQALQELRRRSSMGYERVYFFLQLEPGIQHYYLTNECVGFNKVVDVLKIDRVNATFLGKAEGHGAFGQLIMQQLYQMGTFDMVSYHIMSEYMETLEIMTAGKMTFRWSEDNRKLSLNQRVIYPEKILIDCSIERTEQSIIQDRLCKNWLQNWSIAEAKMILAQIRGKFGALPGAGGNITLNAGDLVTQADKLFEQCKLELDEFVANDPTAWGMGSTFVVG